MAGISSVMRPLLDHEGALVATPRAPCWPPITPVSGRAAATWSR